jgi:HAE1 family hydrophobic/amphiphilic exporter-1
MPMPLMFQTNQRKFQTIEKQMPIDVKFIVTDDSTDNTIAAVNSVVFDLILPLF